MSWIHGARARLALLFSKQGADSRFNEEIGFHIEMEAKRLRRDEGLDDVEARRRAMVAFGGVENHKETLRDGRGLRWLSGLKLDFTLGFRMLVKYPGITVIGTLAMAFAIWVGVITFEFTRIGLYPTLPVPGGDRVVEVRGYDIEKSLFESRILYDYNIWRNDVKTLTDVGAYHDEAQNLVTANGDIAVVNVAETAVTAFRIAPDAPLLGRVLTPADEQPGAPPVVVIGHKVWQTHFAGDSSLVGRSIRLGETFATVVGIMPDGFEFPVAHDAWIPLRLDKLIQSPREGPDVTVFARLADGVTLEQARVELSTFAKRIAAEQPQTHRHLQTQVASYAGGFSNQKLGDRIFMMTIPGFALLLLALVCSNVALLLFARAATRESELIVRTALGASRGRIIAQLFAEALVLGGVAALVGLIVADISLRTIGVAFLEANQGRLPFWYDLRLSATSIVYAVLLTVICALIAGVLPALKVTRGISARLKQGTAGSGGLQFGGVWTAVIVAQVAFTVAFPAIVYVMQRESVRTREFDVGFAANEYLAVALDLDVPKISGVDNDSLQEAHQVRRIAAFGELRQRVAAEPGVTGVTFVDELPRLGHSEAFIELDEPLAPGAQASSGSNVKAYPGEITFALVDPSYFDVLEAPVLGGRSFRQSDVVSNSTNVSIVDQGFVDQVFNGRNPLGRRFRFVYGPVTDPEAPRSSWHEIVGVARELGMSAPTRQGRAAGVYIPVVPGRYEPTYMMVHVAGDPMRIVPRVRALATQADPTLRVTDFRTVDNATSEIVWLLELWVKLTLMLTGIALLLSLAGIYAVLAFTVSKRTREIGIRVALGASRQRVISAIFRRPLTQVAIGVVIGGTLIGALASRWNGEMTPFGFTDGGFTLVHALSVIGYALLMFGVCLLACVVPTRRALRVQPTEALRTE